MLAISDVRASVQEAQAAKVYVLRPAAARRARPARLAPGVYLRRRILAGLVLTVVVVAVWAVLRVLGSATALSAPGHTAPGAPLPSGPHVVQPGETLWGIAERVDPGADPRPVVDRLVAFNGGAQVRVGQVIVIPAT